MKILKTMIFLVIALTALSEIRAQSGRKNDLPPENAEEKIVEKNAPCEKDLTEVIYLAPRKIIAFVEELNRLGACGYQLEAVGKLNLGVGQPFTYINVFGVVKKSGGDVYEYQWFEAFNGGETVTRSNARAKDGFYFRKSLPFRATMELTKEEERRRNEPLTVLTGDGVFPAGSVYFFERRNKIVKEREYLVINGSDDISKKAFARNQKNLDEKVSQGFRPVGIIYAGYFSVHQVLMEKDEEIKSAGEYLFVRYTFNSGKVFSKNAQQGYRLLMLGLDFAVFRRERNAPLPIKYETADSFYDMRKKISQLNGARFEAKGLFQYQLESELTETKPYFAVSTEKGGRKYETKFLEMTNFHERYFKQKDKTAVQADAPTATMAAEFQKLLDEGYVVRDVYSHPELTVIFEREVKL